MSLERYGGLEVLTDKGRYIRAVFFRVGDLHYGAWPLGTGVLKVQEHFCANKKQLLQMAKHQLKALGY